MTSIEDNMQDYIFRTFLNKKSLEYNIINPELSRSKCFILAIKSWKEYKKNAIKNFLYKKYIDYNINDSYLLTL
jgi:hypothetical protein